MVKKTLNPTWDQVIEFKGVLRDLLAKPLELHCYDEDRAYHKTLAASRETTWAPPQLLQAKGIDVWTVKESKVDGHLFGKGSSINVQYLQSDEVESGVTRCLLPA